MNAAILPQACHKLDNDVFLTLGRISCVDTVASWTEGWKRRKASSSCMLQSCGNVAARHYSMGWVVKACG